MSSKKQKIFLILTGVLTGVINGFFGGGGGMVLVPLLIAVLRLQQKTAHATALAVILPISVISAITYLFGGKVEWGLVLLVSIGASLGGVLGAFFLKKINNGALNKIFALLMIVAGAKMLFF